MRMYQKGKRAEGITLIAMIITIIIMLILAGLSLNAIIGENGVLTNALDAVENTRIADAQEAMERSLVSCQAEFATARITNNSLVFSQWLTTEKLNKSLETEGYKLCASETDTTESASSSEVAIGKTLYFVNEEDEIIYEVVITAENNSMGAEVRKLVIAGESSSLVETIITDSEQTLTGETASYKNPIIPVGFKAVNDGASWSYISNDEILGWNYGLVIEDERGNQFVWVPVDGTNVKYEKWDGDVTYAYKDECLDWPLPSTVINENTQIDKYGGFWVGRYEAGIDYTEIASPSTNNNTTNTLYIQKGKQPWNFITYTNAKTVAESYVSNSYVQSGLLTGTQWDTVMKWVENTGKNVSSDSTSWGTYYNTSFSGTGYYTSDCSSSSNYDSSQVWNSGFFSKSTNEGFFNGTGLNSDAVVNNIYDLAGNMWEFTTERWGGIAVMLRGR